MRRLNLVLISTIIVGSGYSVLPIDSYADKGRFNNPDQLRNGQKPIFTGGNPIGGGTGGPGPASGPIVSSPPITRTTNPVTVYSRPVSPPVYGSTMPVYGNPMPVYGSMMPVYGSMMPVYGNPMPTPIQMGSTCIAGIFSCNPGIAPVGTPCYCGQYNGFIR